MRSASTNHAGGAPSGDKSGASRRSGRAAFESPGFGGRLRARSGGRTRSSRSLLECATSRSEGRFWRRSRCLSARKSGSRSKAVYSAFTMDAVVMRSGWDPRGKGAVGIRFVHPTRTATRSGWRTSASDCRSGCAARNPLRRIVSDDAVTPEPSNDPVFIPIPTSCSRSSSLSWGSLSTPCSAWAASIG